MAPNPDLELSSVDSGTASFASSDTRVYKYSVKASPPAGRTAGQEPQSETVLRDSRRRRWPRGGREGASGRIRTCDTWYRKPVLYPLSYGGLLGRREDYRPMSPRRKPRAADTLGRVNPAQLSATVVEAALGARRGRSAHPARRRPARGDGRASATEGARRLRHQRRAPAGQEGRAPTRARWVSCWPTRLREAPGISDVEVAGPGFLNVTVEAGAQGQVAADVVAAGAAYGHTEVARRAEGQRRVHLGQPDRAAAPRPHPVGRAVGDAIAPGAGGGRRRRHPRVLHQRPRRARWTTSRTRSLRPPSASPRRRTATPAATSTTSRQVVEKASPGIFDLPADERRVAVRAQGYALQLRAQKEQLDEVPTRTSTSGSPRTRLHETGAVPQNAGAAARGWATSTTRAARCGCAPPTSVTTRTGS